MKCIRIPGGGILSVPDVTGQTVEVNGRTVYFDFDAQFGPLVTGPHGEDRKQPGERHPFWSAFKVWLKDYQEKEHIAAAMKPPKPVDKSIMLDMSAAGKVKRRGD